jgi:hypothetical protein
MAQSGCYFNSAAVAARAAQVAGAQRVLIVDWDVHHGAGTQVNEEIGWVGSGLVADGWRVTWAGRTFGSISRQPLIVTGTLPCTTVTPATRDSVTQLLQCPSFTLQAVDSL